MARNPLIVSFAILQIYAFAFVNLSERDVKLCSYVLCSGLSACLSCLYLSSECTLATSPCKRLGSTEEAPLSLFSLSLHKGWNLRRVWKNLTFPPISLVLTPYREIQTLFIRFPIKMDPSSDGQVGFDLDFLTQELAEASGADLLHGGYTGTDARPAKRKKAVKASRSHKRTIVEAVSVIPSDILNPDSDVAFLLAEAYSHVETHRKQTATAAAVEKKGKKPGVQAVGKQKTVGKLGAGQPDQGAHEEGGASGIGGESEGKSKSKSKSKSDVAKKPKATEQDKRAKATSKSAALSAAAAAAAADPRFTGRNAPLAPKHDSGPASANQGVYRGTLVGTALFAALQEMTEEGWFQGRDGRLLRRKTLEVFDEEMEEQSALLHRREEQAVVVAKLKVEVEAASEKEAAAAGATAGAGELEGRTEAPAPNVSARASPPAPAPAPAPSFKVPLARKANARPAVLTGTVTKYNQSSGFWTMIVENVTLDTGGGGRGKGVHRNKLEAFPAVTHLPAVKLVFKARDSRATRGKLPKAKVPRAPAAPVEYEEEEEGVH